MLQDRRFTNPSIINQKTYYYVFINGDFYSVLQAYVAKVNISNQEGGSRERLEKIA
jgi:hypothetical protein